MTVLDIPVKTLAGQDSSLGATAPGSALLVVNVASKCGLTPQYAGLQKLYDMYADRGLMIVGVPCNQFGAQEPGTAQEIAAFCTTKYDVTFPIFDKIDVNGPKAHPLYDYLKRERSGLLGSAIKWNFTKFLVDRAGRVTARHAPTTKPESLKRDIEALL